MPSRVAVREVDIEQLDGDLSGLEGYELALVIFRWQGAVVGQSRLPVKGGRVSLAAIRKSLPGVAWAVWKRMVSPHLDTSAPLPSASVVVCTRNRTDELAGCLESLAPLVAQGYEVIIVDNCPSDDSTADLVAQYPNIRYVRELQPGAGAARNRGLLSATQEIVAFTDDDARVDAGWLTALLRNFGDPLVAMVTGITMPLELETDAQIWFEWTNGFQRGFERREFDSQTLNPLSAGLVGASVNLAIRRSVIDEIGLFDEALGPGTAARCGEDHEYFYRALSRGHRIVYEPAALVWHRHRREWDSLRRTIHAYGSGVYAWWTRALFVEKELSLLKLAPQYFWQQHIKNLIRALLGRPGHMPLDLAWAEFRGVLAGPGGYRKARRQLRKRSYILEPKPEDTTCAGRCPITPPHLRIQVKPTRVEPQ
jgi:GT2 family glycosyltransferase